MRPRFSDRAARVRHWSSSRPPTTAAGIPNPCPASASVAAVVDRAATSNAAQGSSPKSQSIQAGTLSRSSSRARLTASQPSAVWSRRAVPFGETLPRRPRPISPARPE